MVFDVARFAPDGALKTFRRFEVFVQAEEGEAAGDVLFRLRLFPAVDVFDDGLVDGSVGNMLRDIVVDDLFGDESGAAVGADARLFCVVDFDGGAALRADRGDEGHIVNSFSINIIIMIT